jgi:SAM-dependent methyltransferase
MPMSLAEYCRRQLAWRSWPTVLDALPALHGRTVLDLGCAVGDQAAELVARGARVIGFDIHDELLAAAQARQLPGAEFHRADLRALPDTDPPADGIWCSFAAAYFPSDLPNVLRSWAFHLRSGGWIALTEVDDMFAHEPLSPSTRELLDRYGDVALAAGRYDFRMGSKLPGHLSSAGFEVARVLELDDLELSFDGPALPEVIDGWATRFDWMTPLREHCGSEYAAVRDEFLGCLASPEHRTLGKVICCIAVKR